MYFVWVTLFIAVATLKVLKALEPLNNLPSMNAAPVARPNFQPPNFKLPTPVKPWQPPEKSDKK